MTVRVLFFAYLRDVTGTAEAALALPAGARVRDAQAEAVRRWPALETQLVRIPIVLDGHVVGSDAPLAEGSELAWLPPVGGGAGEETGAPGTARGGCVLAAEVTEAPLDLARLVSEVTAPSCGAVASFLGVVRDRDEGRPVAALEYQAYDRVAREQIAAVAREAARQWPAARIALVHRTGRLAVGEASVAIAVACPHRDEAFACCRQLIERVKVAVPIWKREHAPEGGEARWLPGHDWRPAGDPGPGAAGPDGGRAGGDR